MSVCLWYLQTWTHLLTLTSSPLNLVTGLGRVALREKTWRAVHPFFSRCRLGRVWFAMYSAFSSSSLSLSSLLSARSLLPLPCLPPDFTPSLISPLPHAFFFLLALSLPAAPPPPSSTSLSVLLSSLISLLFPFQLSQRWLIQRIYRRTDGIIRVNQEWWRSLLQSVDFVIPAEWELGPVATADRHIQKLTLWRKGCFAW